MYSHKWKMIWCLLREGEWSDLSAIRKKWFIWGDISIFNFIWKELYPPLNLSFKKLILQAYSTKSSWQRHAQESIKDLKTKFRMHYQYFIIAFLLNQMPAKILVNQSTSIKNIHTGHKEYHSSWPYNFNICFPVQSSANENIYRSIAVGHELDLLTSLWKDRLMLISLLNNMKSTPTRSVSCLDKGRLDQGTLPEFKRLLWF